MQEVKNKKKSPPQRNSNSIEEYPELLEYNLLNVLGSGSFGKVYKALHKEKTTECAIKVKNEKKMK